MAKKEKKNKPFDSDRFKKAIAHVESSGGKDLWNDDTTATGKYQFMYDEISHLPEMKGMSREEFMNDFDTGVIEVLLTPGKTYP